MPYLKAHVHLNVASATASVGFYEKLFGVPPLRRRAEAATFDLNDPPMFLVVHEESRTGVNVGHLGLLVANEEELESKRLELSERGLLPERRNARLWVEDPDGNGWEILVRP